MNEIVSEVSQIGKIDLGLIHKMSREIAYTTIDWQEVYSDYQSSGWKTVGLINPSGNDQDAIVSDGIGLETKLLLKLPTIKAFLNELGLNYFIVRIANLAPGSYLWEHRDYTELGSEKKIRLHVPLSTNNQCSLIIGSKKIFMDVGYIWKLNPVSAHGVCNQGKTNRIHLILDCYVDNNLELKFLNEYLDPRYYTVLKGNIDEDLIKKTKSLMKLNFFETAEKLILKTYHSTFYREGHAYDLLIKVYNELGFTGRAELWKTKKRNFLVLP